MLPIYSSFFFLLLFSLHCLLFFPFSFYLGFAGQPLLCWCWIRFFPNFLLLLLNKVFPQFNVHEAILITRISIQKTEFFVAFFSLFSKCLNFIETIYSTNTETLDYKKKKKPHTNNQLNNCKKHKTIEDNRKLLIVAN